MATVSTATCICIISSSPCPPSCSAPMETSASLSLYLYIIYFKLLLPQSLRLRLTLTDHSGHYALHRLEVSERRGHLLIPRYIIPIWTLHRPVILLNVLTKLCSSQSTSVHAPCAHDRILQGGASTAHTPWPIQ